MSITVIGSPQAVMPIGNEILVKLGTDNRYSAAGNHASVTFTFTGIDTTTGHSFTLEYGDVSLQFSLAVTPDDSGYQVHTAVVDELVDYWILDFAADLLRNYFIKRDFDVVADIDADTIVLTAKEKGTAFSVTSDFSNVLNLVISEVAGVDPVAREGFEIILVTEILNGSTWIKLAEDRLTPDAQDQATFYLQDLFAPELTAEYTWPEVPETFHALRSNHLKRYRISSAELYDDSVRRLSTATAHRAMLGGFDYKMIAGLNGQEYSMLDFITTYKSFLTWQPTSKKINLTQLEKLYFLVFNEINTLELHIKVYFTDGTDSGSQELVTIAGVNQYDVYELMIGYDQIDFTKISEKTVASYEIWLEDNENNVQSEIRTFIVDTKSFRNERIFLFRNSFGGFDTLRATGRKTHNNEYERLVLEKNDDDFSLQEQYLVLERSVFSQNTGWLTLQQRNWLRQLLVSTEVYEIINGYKFPIILTDEKRDFRDDDNYLYNLEFNYKYAFKDPEFTGDYTRMPLLAENLEILLNEDGQPLYA